MQFKAGMVVYVEGDVDNRVFVLQSGVVDLSYQNLETGEYEHDVLQAGEFFGVKSALGNYPREETANVARDCTTVAFSPKEFEDTALKNPKVILQMLKVYSTQLRNVNRMLSAAKVETHKRRIMSGHGDKSDTVAPVAENPEDGLFKLGEYYVSKRRNNDALFVFDKYIKSYPAGKYISKTKERVIALRGTL